MNPQTTTFNTSIFYLLYANKPNFTIKWIYDIGKNYFI